jgi:hypothetical protein
MSILSSFAALATSAKLKIIGAAAFVTICGGLYAAHAIEVASLQHALDAANRRAERAVASANALKSANDAFSTTIAKQNASIDALKAADAAKAKQVAQAQVQAQTAAQKGYTAAQRTLAKTQSKPGNACASLDDLINETIKVRK